MAMRSPSPPVTGSNPALTSTPLRSRLMIQGNTSQEQNAATRPAVGAARPLSHSSTVTLGLGFLSLLSMRGSARPLSSSL